MKIPCAIVLAILLTSCVSTKSTLKNIDDSAPIPRLAGDGSFIITGYSQDKRYGYDPDYPINVFFRNVSDVKINQERFLKALAGPKGEKLSYTKVETCCPFPTKRSDMGAGSLDIYEITWPNQAKPVQLYFNMYEKGALLVPLGFTLKKVEMAAPRK